MDDVALDATGRINPRSDACLGHGERNGNELYSSRRDALPRYDPLDNSTGSAKLNYHLEHTRCASQA
jgi:hypothetical protein